MNSDFFAKVRSDIYELRQEISEIQYAIYKGNATPKQYERIVEISVIFNSAMSNHQPSDISSLSERCGG